MSLSNTVRHWFISYNWLLMYILQMASDQCSSTFVVSSLSFQLFLSYISISHKCMLSTISNDFLQVIDGDLVALFYDSCCCFMDALCIVVFRLWIASYYHQTTALVARIMPSSYIVILNFCELTGIVDKILLDFCEHIFYLISFLVQMTNAQSTQ